MALKFRNLGGSSPKCPPKASKVDKDDDENEMRITFEVDIKDWEIQYNGSKAFRLEALEIMTPPKRFATKAEDSRLKRVENRK